MKYRWKQKKKITERQNTVRNHQSNQTSCGDSCGSGSSCYSDELRSAPNFLTSGNIIDIIRINSIKGIMCIGMTFVLLTGGIDLSVGAIFAVSGAVTASFISGSYSDYVTSNLMKCNTILAILIGLAAAGILGMINGFVISKMKVEPFIADTGDDDVLKRSHISVYRRISDQFQSTSG